MVLGIVDIGKLMKIEFCYYILILSKLLEFRNILARIICYH